MKNNENTNQNENNARIFIIIIFYFANMCVDMLKQIIELRIESIKKKNANG